MTRLALHWQILIGMVVGAGIGLWLNGFYGDRTTPAPVPFSKGTVHLLDMDQSVPLEGGTVWIADTPNNVLIQVNSAADEDRFVTRRIVVSGPNRRVDHAWPDLPAQFDPEAVVAGIQVPTLGQLKQQDPEAYALHQLYGRSWARWVGDLAQLMGDLFLRMLKMVSIPLIVTSLVTGITGLGQLDQLGKMFSRTLVYYLTTSMLAIVVGLLLVNVIRPGMDDQPAAAAADDAGGPAAAGNAAADQPKPPSDGDGAASTREGKGLGTVLFQQVHTMIPVNPFQALAAGNFLSIIAFSLAFGIFTIAAGQSTARKMHDLFAAAFEVMMRMTMAVIRLAPVGVLFLMLAATATQGIGVFGTLGWYMVTVACALFFHAVVTLPLLLRFVARRSPLEFARAMSPALLTAFSSASSNGTLPLTLTCAEERGGISNRVSSFVLPLGATVNMDGTALYEVVAVLFIAQFSGIDLSLAQQIIVALTALLASIGAAGIPHAGLVMMIIILQAVGLPTESQGLIIAVDRVLDMFRTSVNVWSDSCGCAVVARLTGHAGE
jgi:proton glutamate symport protein